MVWIDAMCNLEQMRDLECVWETKISSRSKRTIRIKDMSIDNGGNQVEYKWTSYGNTPKERKKEDWVCKLEGKVYWEKVLSNAMIERDAIRAMVWIRLASRPSNKRLETVRAINQVSMYSSWQLAVWQIWSVITKGHSDKTERIRNLGNEYVS